MEKRNIIREQFLVLTDLIIEKYLLEIIHNKDDDKFYIDIDNIHITISISGQIGYLNIKDDNQPDIIYVYDIPHPSMYDMSYMLPPHLINQSPDDWNIIMEILIRRQEAINSKINDISDIINKLKGEK